MLDERAQNGEIKNLIERARNNDDQAKAKLIEKYMYLVDAKIKKFEFEPDEDTYQIGYLLLSKAVNNYIESDSKVHLSLAVNNYLESCFPRAVNKSKKSDNIYERTREIRKTPEEYNDLMEMLDKIDRMELTQAYKKVIYMLAQGYSRSEVAEACGRSLYDFKKVFARKRVERAVCELCERERSEFKKR